MPKVSVLDSDLESTLRSTCEKDLREAIALLYAKESARDAQTAELSRLKVKKKILDLKTVKATKILERREAAFATAASYASSIREDATLNINDQRSRIASIRDLNVDIARAKEVADKLLHTLDNLPTEISVTRMRTGIVNGYYLHGNSRNSAAGSWLFFKTIDVSTYARNVLRDGAPYKLPNTLGAFYVFVGTNGQYLSAYALPLPGSYYYPHIMSDYSLCLGNAANDLLRAITHRDYTTCISVIESWFATYNRTHGGAHLYSLFPNVEDADYADQQSNFIGDSPDVLSYLETTSLGKSVCADCLKHVGEGALLACGSCSTCCEHAHDAVPDLLMTGVGRSMTLCAGPQHPAIAHCAEGRRKEDCRVTCKCTFIKGAYTGTPRNLGPEEEMRITWS